VDTIFFIDRKYLVDKLSGSGASSYLVVRLEELQRP
jgi:hypothetical protein